MREGAVADGLRAEAETALAAIGQAADMARQAQEGLPGAGLAAGSDVELKSGPADLVSRVDRDIDHFIVSRLLDRFPADGSLSEEGGERAGTSGRTWVVDPIDGTHNYLAGLPHYAISIALLAAGQTQLGLIYDATDGTVHGAVAGPEGTAAPLPVAGRSPRAGATGSRLPVASALVAVNLPVAAIFSGTGCCPALKRVGDIRVTGSICLDLVWTATGRFDACAYRHRNNPWDWAAGELIALSRGRPVIPAEWNGVAIVLAGRPEVTAALADSGA